MKTAQKPDQPTREPVTRSRRGTPVAESAKRGAGRQPSPDRPVKASKSAAKATAKEDPHNRAGGRPPLGEWLLTWFGAAAVAMVHVSLLVCVSQHVAGDLVSYAVMAAPALILMMARPRPTARKGYRWLAVWAITLTSLVSTPALLVAEAWVLRQTWLESGHRAPSLGRIFGLRSFRGLRAGRGEGAR